MFFDDMNPVDLDLLHDAVDINKIFFYYNRMVTPPWS